MSHIVIKNTRSIGRGVFIAERVCEGQTIFVMSGYLIKDRERAVKLNCTSQIGKNIWLYPSSPGRYLNHSCNPNAILKNGIKLISIKQINPGEEVTIDYSTTEDDIRWSMKCCKCGSENCRKTIESIQTLPKKQFL